MPLLIINKMVNKKIICVILLSILLVSCLKEEQQGTIIKQKITLKTSDGLTIYGNFYPEDTKKGVVLLHMYDQDKNSWSFFIDTLREESYNVLAIDLRGHGESDLTLSSMTSQDFNDMILDAKAAFDYLNEKGIHEVSLIGASLGANVALNYAVTEESIQRTILISPGLDYRGIVTSDVIREYKRPLLIIVGGLDEYSSNSSDILFSKSPSKVKLQPYNTSLHGVEILKNIPESKDLIINWMKAN